MKLIDKDALIAEIERRIASLESIGSENYLHDNCPVQYAMLVTLKSLRFSIDTLEVKEVGNVWHDAGETPKGAGDKEILVQFTDYHASVLEIDDWEYLDHQTKWAYLKDLT